MNHVLVPIPLSPEAAQMLAAPGKREEVGRLLSDLLRPSRLEDDPLARLLAEVKAEARADGLTDAEIEAELAAYNAENRL